MPGTNAPWQAVLDELLGVSGRRKRRRRVLATVAAQAFLHHSSALRRTAEAGGSLEQSLGDVRDGETLRGLVVDLHMQTYLERVAEKMRQWRQVGADITYGAADRPGCVAWVPTRGCVALSL